MPATERLNIRLTPDERTELREATSELGNTPSDFARLAIGDALADWRERRVFQRRQRTQPVDIDRRTGADRRQS